MAKPTITHPPVHKDSTLIAMTAANGDEHQAAQSWALISIAESLEEIIALMKNT